MNKHIKKKKKGPRRIKHNLRKTKRTKQQTTKQTNNNNNKTETNKLNANRPIKTTRAKHKLINT